MIALAAASPRRSAAIHWSRYLASDSLSGTNADDGELSQHLNDQAFIVAMMLMPRLKPTEPSPAAAKTPSRQPSAPSGQIA
ncbi:MAG TPA: hypothetical protein VFY06_02945 [Verrucomicrobiae bacterium]|nr:hypothetical protein [Verrucomicrobiae bacterium]